MDLAILVFLTVLLISIPLVVIAVVLCLIVSFAFPAKRKLPEDLPNDLFDGKPASTATVEANEAATSEFKKSFGASARKRFATIIGRVNAYFNIQKRY